MGSRTEAGGRAAFFLILITLATPLLLVGSILMTIDPPLVLCWMWVVVAGWRESALRTKACSRVAQAARRPKRPPRQAPSLRCDPSFQDPGGFRSPGALLGKTRRRLRSAHQNGRVELLFYEMNIFQFTISLLFEF